MQRREEQARSAAILQEQLAERQRQRLREEEMRDQVGGPGLHGRRCPLRSQKQQQCVLSGWTTTLAGNAPTLQEAAFYTMPQCCTACLTLWLSEPLQERMAMARELERLQHEEAAAAAAKKARAAAIMEEVCTTHEQG